MSEGREFVISSCYVCREVKAFDIDTAVVVEIDPATGVPPDVDPYTGATLPEPRDVETVQRMICSECVEKVNAERRRHGMQPI